MIKTYFPMHNHSMFSFLDGYATPKEYLERAKEIGLKGFAITEHGNQCSWVYFDEIKKDYKDIKMVYGIEFYLCDDVQIKDPQNKYYHFVALAKDEDGRKILNRLQRLSKNNFYNKPRVDLEMFKKEDCSHLIVSSACLASALRKNMDNFSYCVELVKEYKSVFSNFYLEMQSHYHKDQEVYNQFIITLATATKTKFVITTDSHYATIEDAKYQGRHVQIAHDDETASEFYEGCYLQTVEEIHECMDNQIGYDNVEKGLQETLNILDLIDEVNMPWQEGKLPHFPIPNSFSSEKEYIKYLAKDVGWYTKHIDNKSIKDQQIYTDRVNYELEIIDSMGFNGYFLIEWEWVKWAKENGVAVGVARGSSAGSLVNYLLNITEVDPVKYGLIFERFLNYERDDFPKLYWE